MLPATTPGVVALCKFKSRRIGSWIRVTRMGEFSHNGWMFALGSYMKITEVAHIFRSLYLTVKFVH
jgi:hypothetical protein